MDHSNISSIAKGPTRSSHLKLSFVSFRAPCNTFYDEEQLRFASDWILAWSCISLTAVIASLLYFYLNKDRFYDIERPILYLTCCYVPVAVAYIIGFGADKTSIACYEGQGTEGTHLNETAQRIEEWKNAPCVITFLLSSYFETAAHTWFESILFAEIYVVRKVQIWTIHELPVQTMDRQP